MEWQKWACCSKLFCVLEEFRQTLEHTDLNKFVKFNFDTDFVKLHFGNKRERKISYSEFTQVLWVSF